MENFGSIVGIIGGVCGILVLLTGALVFAKGSFSKARIEALRDDNEDLRSRVSDLEKKEALQHKDIERLQGENELLKEMVTQRAQVDAVVSLLNMHHEQAVDTWIRLSNEMGYVSTELAKLVKRSGS